MVGIIHVFYSSVKSTIGCGLFCCTWILARELSKARHVSRTLLTSDCRQLPFEARTTTSHVLRKDSSDALVSREDDIVL